MTPIATFQHEKQAITGETFSGYLVNRGPDPMRVTVITFGGEEVTWRIGLNEIIPVQILKLVSIDMGNSFVLDIVW